MFVSSFQSFTVRKKNLRKIALSTWQRVPVSSPKKSLAKPESCLCSRNFKPTTRRKVSVCNLWHRACLERVVFCLKEITLPRRKEQLGHTFMCVWEEGAQRCLQGQHSLRPDQHRAGYHVHPFITIRGKAAFPTTLCVGKFSNS